MPLTRILQAVPLTEERKLNKLLAAPVSVTKPLMVCVELAATVSVAALLTDFATDAEFRSKVKSEFAGTKALFGDYVAALKNAYPLPPVKDPR